MKNNPVRIIIEGEVGTGKSVLADYLSQVFQEMGINSAVIPSPEYSAQDIAFSRRNDAGSQISLIHRGREIDIVVRQRYVEKERKVRISNAGGTPSYVPEVFQYVKKAYMNDGWIIIGAEREDIWSARNNDIIQVRFWGLPFMLEAPRKALNVAKKAPRVVNDRYGGDGAFMVPESVFTRKPVPAKK